MNEIQAGWLLLQISGVMWVFYLGSRALDDYRHRKMRQQKVIGMMVRPNRRGGR